MEMCRQIVCEGKLHSCPDFSSPCQAAREWACMLVRLPRMLTCKWQDTPIVLTMHEFIIELTRVTASACCHV